MLCCLVFDNLYDELDRVSLPVSTTADTSREEDDQQEEQNTSKSNSDGMIIVNYDEIKKYLDIPTPSSYAQ